ncbi:hypothetical protein K504DRAFT_465666 [Pleomassaria siparia CBS 279.74]|uniref:Uncharacterized protein n=1 Tax=Pleomassaria siparia CBS 279.74 TaxID=1314801 RepID=A0A6G1KHQ9_9PLEO|nr:hypothetical protein K504DRAFT_465666 [Pleomassaria siparia CBS 279.74]
MAIFNDLAVELQEAIWELVLPASRGVHWIEVEGIPHDPEFVRDSIRLTQWHKFDRMPETYQDVLTSRRENPEFNKRARTKTEVSSPFFRHLLTTVPAVFGKSGSDDDALGHEDSEELQHDLADEIAYTHRCRQLSTYYQIAALLSICRLSRNIAERYIQDNSKCSWPVHRSMGSPYRPRPMDVWEVQYSGDKIPPVSRNLDCWQVLPPRIHTLDLVVFRLHDSQGRATPLLKHAPWQYHIETHSHSTSFACFDRVGFEYHPSWGTVGGRGELRSQNVQAIFETMTAAEVTLYWLVDGVPRPDWKRDYPAVVGNIFAQRMAQEKKRVLRHLNTQWELSDGEQTALLADHHLGQEFEANGRRYYIVFVVFSDFDMKVRRQLDKAGLGYSGPFPGNAAMWPEALREPVRLAYDVGDEDSHNMGTSATSSYILSWEPICI